jgi:PKD repeat protein
LVWIKSGLFAVLSVGMALLPLSGYGQSQRHCGTDEYHATLAGFEERRAATDAEIGRWIAQRPGLDQNTPEAIYTIPVVFHVMYYDQTDNISDAQIEDALVRLNKDFRRLNSDAGQLRSIFTARAADLNIEFVRAKVDPAGKCTNGITRTQTPLTLAASNNVKSVIGWDNKKYLNIWIVRDIDLAGTQPGVVVLGYSAFPYNGIPLTQDGIVIRHDQMGASGTAVSNGRTLTHEAGHYFNLYHTFQGGCNGGDQCGDTPPVVSASDGCNKTQNTCTNDVPDLPDMLENYMDYSNDNCMNTFTLDQRSRAWAVLNSFNLRGSLTAPSNLVATGATVPLPTCIPVTDWKSDRRFVCAGDSVQFTELAIGYKPLFYHWTLMDAYQNNQFHLMTRNPKVRFTQPGQYKVELNVSNSDGSSTVTRDAYITVHPATAPPVVAPSWTMENVLPNKQWTVEESGDKIGWESTTAAAHSGARSVRLRHFDVKSPGGGDFLTSAPVATGGTGTLVLKFWVAFAKKLAGNTDQLRIYTSADCGSTWNLERIVTTFQLNTTANLYASVGYIPQPTDWKELSVVLSAGAAAAPEVMVRFESINGGGNNLYLDDIRLSYRLGLDDDEAPAPGLVAYPNPGQDRVVLHGPEGARSAPGDWTATDLLGRTMWTAPASEDTVLEVDTRLWPVGVYWFRRGADAVRWVKE